MGSGGQKAHEAIAIAPAAVTDVTVEDLDTAELYELGDTGAIDDVDDLVSQLGPDDYDSFVAMANGLQDEDYGLGDDIPEHIQALKDTELKALTKSYLGNLSAEDLQQLAADHGFDHPTLVGLNESDQHPLVHWLDPAYPDDLATKAKIQVKANERYQALQAGQTIAGMTLADVHAAEANLGIHTDPVADWATWDASPAEVATAMADVTARASSIGTLAPADKAAGVAELVAAENKLQAASCPELGAGLDEMKGAAAQLVDLHTKSAVGYSGAATATALQEAGLLSKPEAQWLSPSEALTAARYASGAATRSDLQAAAAARGEVIAQLETYKANGIGTKAAFANIDTSTEPGRQQLLETINATQHAFALTAQAHGWQAADSNAVKAAALHPYPSGAAYHHKDLSKDFRAWAKTQKLADLRTVAEAAGLSDATKAGTRAQIQSYLAGQWDTNIDQSSIEATVKAKAAAKTGSSTAPPPKATPQAVATPQNVAAAAKSATVVASGPGRFTGKLGTLAAKLKAHQQIAADLPARTDTATVATHSWDAGESWSKGSHESSLHTGPDGAQWMFKPDKSAKGARAHAEAAASNVFHRVGVAGVDVHVVTIGNRTGAIQPLVKGASNLEASPSSWSQADVDSVVRLHVAAWAVGDHDGHTSNVMRSPSGAVFAVDQGQAFKFFGRDKLDHGWHPTGNYGTPVYHQAYTAHQHGGLGTGVQVRAKAALPIIKAFEALPDAQYRQMLTPTAHEGVKHGVHWVEPMRKAAQTRLGKSTVTDSEVAEEFLRTAVDRKNNLRTAFAGFLGGLGVSDAQHLTWVK